jgi:hypothetical protein
MEVAKADTPIARGSRRKMLRRTDWRPLQLMEERASERKQPEQLELPF